MLGISAFSSRKPFQNSFENRRFLSFSRFFSSTNPLEKIYAMDRDISIRRKWNLLPTFYQPNIWMEDAIKFHLLRPYGGLSILAAPEGAGKSTAVRKVLSELKTANQINGSVIIDGTLFDGHYPDTKTKFSQILGSDPFNISGNIPENPQKVDQHFPVTIVFDHFDHLAHDNRILWFVYHLAHDSTLYKKTNVLICVDSPTLAKYVSQWNSGHKFILIRPRFTNQIDSHSSDKSLDHGFCMQTSAIDQLLEATRPGRNYRDTVEDTLRQYAYLARTPKFILSARSMTLYRNDDKLEGGNAFLEKQQMKSTIFPLLHQEATHLNQLWRMFKD